VIHCDGAAGVGIRADGGVFQVHVAGADGCGRPAGSARLLAPSNQVRCVAVARDV
jgi:hypothetical protein